MAVSALEVRIDNEVATLQLQISQQGALLNDLNTGMMVFEKGAFGEFLPHTRQRLGMAPVASPSDDQAQPSSMPSQIGLLKAQVYDLGLGVNGLRDEVARLVKRLSEMEQGFFTLRGDANRDLQSLFTQVNALRDSIVGGLGIVETHLSMEKDSLSLASFPPSLIYTPSDNSPSYPHQQQYHQQQQQQPYQPTQPQTLATPDTTSNAHSIPPSPSHSLTSQQLKDLVQLQDMELEELKKQHEAKEKEEEEKEQARFVHQPDPEFPGAEEQDDPLLAQALLKRMQSALLKDHLQHEHSQSGHGHAHGQGAKHAHDHDIDVSINTGGKVRKATIATDHQHHGHDHPTTPTPTSSNHNVNHAKLKLTALDAERQRQEHSDHERVKNGEVDHDPPVIQVISGFRSLTPLPPMVDA